MKQVSSKTLITGAIAAMIGKNSAFPILENLLIQDGNIIMGDFKTTATLKNVGIPGHFTIHKKDFIQVMNSMTNFTVKENIGKRRKDGPDEVISTSFSNQNGKETLTYFSDNPHDFPNTRNGKEHLIGGLTVEDIQKLSIASKFVSTDIERPKMTHVAIKDEFIVGTDAHTLYFERCNFKYKKEILIHPRIIKLMTLFHEMDCFHVSVCDPIDKSNELDKGTLIFENRFVRIVTRRHDEEFVPYREVIPKDNPTSALFDKKKLRDTLAKSLSCGNKIANVTAFDISEDGTVDVSAKDIDHGNDYSAQLLAKVKGPGLMIGFDAKLMDKCLSIGDQAAVSIALSDPTRAAIIDNRILLMPRLLTD